jgi:predicted RecB family nuclease
MLGEKVNVGKIIHGDDHKMAQVRIPAQTGEVQRHLEEITTLLCSPPDLLLIRHCSECEFQARCRQKAVEKDDLSLLSGMTVKERKKLHSKGIFTVTQLSYTFRPRRRPKRLRDKREKYHHALKALAIRENKIHIVGSPELRIDGTPVYLDVEGLPDRDFYYLIGVRCGNPDAATQHSLWADNIEDEKRIWTEFLAILEKVHNPVLIHYGSYETTFLKRMCDRYGLPLAGHQAATAVKAAVNLLSVIFAQVYFPTSSNGLKDIGHFLGVKWSGPVISGLQSVACRLNWEQSRGPELKAALVAYNSEDCAALEVLTSHRSGVQNGCRVFRQTKEVGDGAGHRNSPHFSIDSEVGATQVFAFPHQSIFVERCSVSVVREGKIRKASAPEFSFRQQGKDRAGTSQADLSNASWP